MVGGLRGHDGLGVEPQPCGPGVHCHHHQCSIDPSWNDVGGRGGIRPPGEEVGRPPCLVARVARVARELPRPRTFLEPAAQPENLISHLDFKVQAGVCPINIEYLYKATRTSLNKPPRLKASQMTKPSPTCLICQTIKGLPSFTKTLIAPPALTLTRPFFKSS